MSAPRVYPKDILNFFQVPRNPFLYADSHSCMQEMSLGPSGHFVKHSPVSELAAVVPPGWLWQTRLSFIG